MRKAILTMLLAIVSSSAMAEWVLVGVNETATLYYDSSAIQRAGNRVKMLTLFDLRTARYLNGKAYLSMQMQKEFDCDGAQSRTLSASAYSGNMGAGEVIDTRSDPDEWNPVSVGSAQETELKVACGSPLVEQKI